MDSDFYIITIGVLKDLTNKFVSEVESLQKDIRLLAEHEQKEKSSSGFVVSISTNVSSLIDKFKSFDFDTNLKIVDMVKFRVLYSKSNSFKKQLKDFKTKLDTYKISKKHDKTFNDISEKLIDSFQDLMIFCISLFQEFEQQQELLNYNKAELANSKQGYAEIIQNYNAYETKFKELKEKFEAVIIDKDIADIKQHYNDLDTKNDKSIKSQKIYFISMVVVMFVFIFISFFTIICSKSSISGNEIFIYILLISLFGLVSFLITDARKRYNISLSILDEIQQKKVLVDSYSSLLGKAKNIEDKDVKKEYEKQVLQNIIDNILSIKNHGYIGKDMQNMSPNIYLDTLNKIYLEALSKTGKNST